MTTPMSGCTTDFKGQIKILAKTCNPRRKEITYTRSTYGDENELGTNLPISN
jgi:hypothetical protein